MKKSGWYGEETNYINEFGEDGVPIIAVRGTADAHGLRSIQFINLNWNASEIIGEPSLGYEFYHEFLAGTTYVYIYSRLENSDSRLPVFLNMKIGGYGNPIGKDRMIINKFNSGGFRQVFRSDKNAYELESPAEWYITHVFYDLDLRYLQFGATKVMPLEVIMDCCNGLETDRECGKFKDPSGGACKQRMGELCNNARELNGVHCREWCLREGNCDKGMEEYCARNPDASICKCITEAETRSAANGYKQCLAGSCESSYFSPELLGCPRVVPCEAQEDFPWDLDWRVQPVAAECTEEAPPPPNENDPRRPATETIPAPSKTPETTLNPPVAFYVFVLFVYLIVVVSVYMVLKFSKFGG